MVVIAGKDKGKKGVIIKTLRDTDQVIVQDVNVLKKHVRGNDTNPGGIVDITHPIHVSNVAFADTKNNKSTRIGYLIKDGKKVRVAKSSGTEIK